MNNHPPSSGLLDLDWFGKDSQGNIAVFWTFGSEIPDLIQKKMDNMPRLLNLFSSLDEKQNQSISFSDLALSKKFIDKDSETKYLELLKLISGKGIFIYDFVNNYESTENCYYKLTTPEILLSVDFFPVEVRDLFISFPFEIDFRNTFMICP